MARARVSFRIRDLSVMQAFSEGPGLGSKFIVRLPRIEPAPGVGERPGLAASPPVSIA